MFISPNSLMKRAIAICIWLFPYIGYSQVVTDSTKHRLDSLQNLNAVVVKGSLLKFLRETPGNITVVDVKPFYNSNITAVQILRQTAGVKVKQNGGYGSRVEYFINGSTGKQLKFFLDGLPLDNIGESQGLNNLAIEQIDRIEIYKGVIPIDLGADALGGAINIITRKEKQNYLDASYAISSFGTHRINLLGKKYWHDKFYTAFQAVSGRSKNNYTITADIPDENGNLYNAYVKRFHDDYNNYILKADAGFNDLTWADQLTFSLSGSGLDKEIQNNLYMTQPYGKITDSEKLYRGVLTYEKNNIFKRINLKSFLSYNRLENLFVDTSKNIYTWDGNLSVIAGKISRKPFGGEISTSGNELYNYTDKIDQRLTASYWLNNNSKILFSNTLQYYHRKGKDTVAQNFYNGQDFFGTPSTMLKNIYGLSYNGTFRKFEFSTAIKLLNARVSGFELNGNTLLNLSQQINKAGYNAALTYKLSKSVLIKSSFEQANRLPDESELFGDIVGVLPNPDIKPETSRNFNLNFLYQTGKLSAEVTGFYRRSQNLIYFKPNSVGNRGSFANLFSANITGVETSVSFFPTSYFTITANATYQDLRNKSLIENEPQSAQYINSRLPNIPYLLLNTGFSYTKNNLLHKGSQLKLFWNSSYTHEYYLYWENDGKESLKNVIPTQFLHNAGLSYSVDSQLTLTLESYNLTNQTAYDNFKAQLPGRSFSLKTRYYLFKSLKQ